MLDQLPTIGVYQAYALALVALWSARGLGRRYRTRQSLTLRRTAEDVGATESPSLHPLVDPARCVGCGACTHACPEGPVLGLVGTTATLLDPASCIGHGACKDACPVGAITLVLGSPTRGIDVPVVSSDLETDVPGLYVAGELGGIGLVANAIEQGRKAIDAIAHRPGARRKGVLDLVVIGAGPAGFAASLAAREKGMDIVTLEQAQFAGTVAQYPRGKMVMTRPVRLPLHGALRIRRIRKEKLIALWQGIARKSKLDIRYGERVERIVPTAWGFDVETETDRYSARSVLLATGRRGSPKKLGVPGEASAKVAYRLIEAAHYANQRVLVVGGGDSALETALALSRRGDVAVSLSHRGLAFDRAKPANRARLETAEAEGRITVMRESSVAAVADDAVTVLWKGRRQALANDAVIVCIGGRLPTELMSSIGVAIATRRGTP